MNTLTHTVAAVSTPPGKGGVALIRMSGGEALEIASRAFASASGRAISDYLPRTQIYGYIMDGGEHIDDVLLTYFPSPSSYTGEDTVEICCHGGTVITRTVLETLFSLGARPAEAGEFTRRAFINGKLSLSEAEAIGTLLDAKSREQIKLFSSPSRTRLEDELTKIRASIVEIMSSMYARIDYPDEDLGDFSDEELYARLSEISSMLMKLISTYKTGRAVSDGISVAICGKTNVGKSSLYNLLVGEDAAIVTDIKGTTTDVLTRSVPFGKVMLNIADTAGIRNDETVGTVERIGIEKSRQMIEKCELLFTIFDISRPFDDEDRDILSAIKESSAVKIAILNKCDSAPCFDEKVLGDVFDETIKISVKDGGTEARADLADLVNRLFTDERISIGTDAVVSSARHFASLTRAYEFISLALEGMSLGFAQDAVSADIERALGAVSELDGKAVSEEVTASIFSKFCVGK